MPVPTTVITKSRRPRVTIPRWVRRLIGPIVLIGGWQLASNVGLLDEKTLPPPSVVFTTGWDLWQSGELRTDLWVSLNRAMTGLAIGVAIGVVLAAISGLFRLGEDLVDAPMQMLRTMPVLALVPLFIVWFGIGETPKIAMVALATIFPIYLNTYAGIRNVDHRLVEAGATLGLGRLGLIRHVVLPGALPSFLVGLRFSLGIAWLVLVVSEQINATSGLGYLMMNARMVLRTDIIVVGVIVYCLLGLLSDIFVRFLERTALSWRPSFSGT